MTDHVDIAADLHQPWCIYVEAHERPCNCGGPALVVYMLDALRAISRLTSDERPSEEELDGPHALHYTEHLGRWDAAAIARKAIAKATGEA